MADEVRWARRFIVAVVATAVIGAGLAAAYAAGKRAGREDAERDQRFVPPSTDLVPVVPFRVEPPTERLGPDRPLTRPTLDDPGGGFAAWFDRDGGAARRLRVFEPDGRVLELHGSIADAGAADFTTFRLSGEEPVRVMGHVRRVTAMLDPELRSAGGTAPVRALSLGVVISAAPGHPLPGATELVALVDDLFSLRSLGVATDPRPWTPDVVTARIDRAPEGADVVSWPLPDAVLAEVAGTGRGPGGDEVAYRCLTGDDAARVFQLLSTGGGR